MMVQPETIRQKEFWQRFQEFVLDLVTFIQAAASRLGARK